MAGLPDLVHAAHDGSAFTAGELRGAIELLMESGDTGRAELHGFLRRASPRDWIVIDASMRPRWYDVDRSARGPWWRRAWNALRSAEERPPDVLSVGLTTMQPDGRAREAAVRQLPAEPDPLAASFLALRTADWVQQVAVPARSILSERMASEPSLVIAAAGLLFALEGRQRRSGLDRIVLERAASDAEVRAALLASSDRTTRRRVLGEGAVRAACELPELTALARSEPDTVVAALAGKEVVARIAAADPSGARLELLLGGPAPVRCAVLDALGERSAGRAAAARHLFDRSPIVRAAAQRAFARTGGDAAEVYRTALRNSERVPVALTELAALGSADDHAAILAALHGAEVATRRAAVGAVHRIAPDRLCELLVPLLRDPSAGVVGMAVRRLRPRARDLDLGVLQDLASAPLAFHRRAAQRLLRRRAPMERLEADLLALADPDDSIRSEALSDVQAWLLHQAANAPRGDVRSRLRVSRLLGAVEQRLRSEEVAQLRFHAGLRPQDLQA